MILGIKSGQYKMSILTPYHFSTPTSYTFVFLCLILGAIPGKHRVYLGLCIQESLLEVRGNYVGCRRLNLPQLYARQAPYWLHYLSPLPFSNLKNRYYTQYRGQRNSPMGRALHEADLGSFPSICE